MPFKYYGGVHPDYAKTASKTPVRTISPPPVVVLPMIQQIGAPNRPVVKVGDTVKMGQLIGTSDAPVSAPVHASVSGKVIAVEPRRHMLGDMVMSVVIENDFQDTPCEDMKPLTEEQLRDPDAIVARIREAGVVGMGGAMFPTAFKIQGARGKVDTVIINGAECEPYLCGDHRTMLEHPEELLKGIELVRIAHGLDKCFYGIEKNKQDAIDLLNSLDPAKYGVEIVPEVVKYPQGAEKMQVKANTNREVKPGGLPSGVGCNVVSTYTAYTIYHRARGDGGWRLCTGGAESALPFRHPAGVHLQRGRSGYVQGRAHLHGRTHDGHLRGGPDCRQRQRCIRPAALQQGYEQGERDAHLYPLRQLHRPLPDEARADVHVYVRT